MDPPQQPQPLRHLPPLQSILPSQHAPISTPSRTASSTPISSPGLFSPTTNPRANMSFPSQPASEGATPPAVSHSPYLHPLQSRRVRETSRANVDRDFATGRKLINQYEVIEEIGRGQHGKVKLARNLENNEFVAIKIVPRLSKTRRLGKLSARDPQQNINREIAILKKIRHPNVVALLEVIDDSELKKIYMVLEHVERGEIVWRKKGLPNIHNFERHRLEKEMRGEEICPNEEEWLIRPSVSHASNDGSRPSSRVPSRNASAKSMSRAATPSLSDVRHPPAATGADGPAIEGEEDLETPVPLRSNQSSSMALEGTMYGAYTEDALLRARSPSMADSIISHMSSLDFDADHHYHDDFDYVPCFTMESARTTFRDTVLGLEYLHYQGVVHRDIKPANLLWTKEHRVKISDFGVSYFGRPIRDSEDGETMSESEAQNFDDDRELSKTVGTPAFFAPELCYTDETKDPPRVSEQIDVWSLGVTLYCLVFARIPFIADDEYSMFRKIATDEVFIPRRRLRPVHPITDPNKASTDRSGGQDPYRRDSDLAYEDIDEGLVELLRAMLTKNPDKRIRLRDVKRHPWVMHGIENMVGWLDDTDPSRTSGRKIQVDERDIGRAVVPLTLLERARSTFKKAVGKVLPGRSDRSESSSRRRATSSAASSSGEGSHHSPAHYHREARRKSLRGDDCFATVTQLPSSDHPLTQSVTASPIDAPGAGGIESETKELSLWQTFKAATSQQSTQHSHARSVTDVELGSPLRPSRTVPGTPAAAGSGHDPLDDALNNGRSDISNAPRARSMDRAGLLFQSADKRASPRVGICTAVAPGSVNRPQTPTGLGYIVKGDEPPSASSSPRASVAYSNVLPKSDTNIYEKRRFAMVERPSTAQKVEDFPDTQQHLPRLYNSSTPESFVRGREQHFEYLRQIHSAESTWAVPASHVTNPSRVPCSPSPDRLLSSRGEIKAGDPPARRDSRPDDDSTLDSQSHPSLPALMSGASSVSADMEGEFLGNPGVVDGRQTSLMGTTDSVTPPALDKEPTAFPLEQQEHSLGLGHEEMETRIIPLLDVNGPRNSAAVAEARSYDDSEDSDSDEGVLTMARRRRKNPHPPKEVSSLVGSLGVGNPTRRRDTNTSIASTETAKKAEADRGQS